MIYFFSPTKIDFFPTMCKFPHNVQFGHALVHVLVYALVDVTGETGQARAAKPVQETKLNSLSYCASRKSKQEI